MTPIGEKVTSEGILRAFACEQRFRKRTHVPPEESSKLDSLPRRDYIAVDPQDIVHVDWSDTWRPDST